MGHLFTLHVDGSSFQVSSDEDQPGVAHFTWLNGPNPGYGFTIGRSDGELPTRVEAEVAVRGFLDSVDPSTGYL
jgi:hypothetical protein